MMPTKYTLEQNLIIKNPLPKVGIICSNPRRVERIVKSHLSNVVFLKEYTTAWQLDVYIGSYQNKNMFIAVVPVGASGAGFVIQQLVVAGAQHIIRYGSNDAPDLTAERMDEVIIVDCADNLFGLMQSSGAPSEVWGKPIYASKILQTALQKKAEQLGLVTRSAICHHVEDYNAYAFPENAGEYSKNIINHIAELESNNIDYLHCRDMESAVLFYRSHLDGFHGATVLQNVPKFSGKHQTYDGKLGEMAIQLEAKFCDLVFGALVPFADDYHPDFRSYIELDKKLLPDYLKSLVGFEEFSNSAEIVIDEIGDGNLNNVFRIKNIKTGNSIIIKQALPYLKCVGKEHKLSSERMRFEINYVLQAVKHLPIHMPKLFYSDSEAMMLMGMQDLCQHQVMRNGLMQGIYYPNFDKHIATFLATVLFKTSRLYLNDKEYSNLQHIFNGNQLCKLTEEFIFTFPYMVHPTNYLDKSRDDFSFIFRKNALNLLHIFSTRADALIHADLHTGSIMLNQSETYIIDNEFAFMGPMGFDLGLLIANLISAWIFHVINTKDLLYSNWIVNTIENCINRFNMEFCLLWNENADENLKLYFSSSEFAKYQHTYLINVLREAIGFAGLEICRRVCGIAGVKEIRELHDSQAKTNAQDLALQIGKELVENYYMFDNIEDVTMHIRKKIRQLSPEYIVEI